MDYAHHLEILPNATERTRLEMLHTSKKPLLDLNLINEYKHQLLFDIRSTRLSVDVCFVKPLKCWVSPHDDQQQPVRLSNSYTLW